MSRLTRRIKETSNFNYTIVIHTGDFTVSKHALCMLVGMSTLRGDPAPI